MTQVKIITEARLKDLEDAINEWLCTETQEYDTVIDIKVSYETGHYSAMIIYNYNVDDIKQDWFEADTNTNAKQS